VGLNGLPLNTYISMYARTNRCYNERGSRTNYVRSSIPHCTCNRVLPTNKLSVPQPVKISPNFTEPGCSSPHSQHRVHILRQINPVHAPNPTPGRSTLILSSHLRLGLTSGLLRSGLKTSILSPYVLHAPAHLILLYLITRIIFGE
jgi:hypothetical protein